jgi:hypothetical protein
MGVVGRMSFLCYRVNALELARMYYRTGARPVIWVIVQELALVCGQTDVFPVLGVIGCMVR